MSKRDEIRNKLEPVMNHLLWFSSEELMEATGYNSREIYGAMKPWKNAGRLRKRKRGETNDIEYRLARR